MREGAHSCLPPCAGGRFSVLAVAFTFVLAAMSPGRALGQRAIGSVLDSLSGHAVPGAIVSIVGAAHPARAITDEDGRFSLAVAMGTTALRIVRIGFHPRDVPLPKSEQARRAMEIRLAMLPALLTNVRVSENPICSGAGDHGGALTLWEQARAALLATVVVRQTRPAQMAVLDYNTDEDGRSHLVEHQAITTDAGATGRPFIAVAQAAGFAERGYAVRDSSGLTFMAPDADVLLDPQFARTHCFGVTRDDAAHPGAVGLTFEPAPGSHRSGFVDIRGTLWMASRPAALQQLQFSYTGPTRAYIEAGAGGRIHFRTMSNGLIYVDSWKLLLPAIAEAAPRSGVSSHRFDPEPQSHRTSVRAYREVGGVVLSARWPGGLVAHTTLPVVTGVVREERTHRAIAGVAVQLDGTPQAVTTDSSGRFSLPWVLPGKYTLRASDTAFAAFLEPRRKARVIDVGADSQDIGSLEVPSRRDAVRTVCDGGGHPTGAALFGTVSAPPGPVPSGVEVRVEGAGESISSVRSAASRGHPVTPDDSGRFRLCGLPTGRILRLTLLRQDTILADTSVLVEPGITAKRFNWVMTPRAAHVAGALAGTVEADGSAPLVGAEVHLAGLDSARVTNADGQFSFPELRPGSYVVQVRRLGFLPLSDSVTVVGGRTARRLYELFAQPPMLDTVRQLADSVRYISPALRAFDHRRLSGEGGYFLGEQQLRSLDNERLADAMRSRFPGIIWVSYRAMTFAASQRGTSSGIGSQPHALPYDPKSPRGCWVSVFLDGVRIYDPGGGGAAPDFQLMAANEFGGVEYYPGGATIPEQFRTMSQGDCGAVLLWTRER